MAVAALGGLGMALSGVSALVGTMGALWQGQAASAQANYKAKVAKNFADYSRSQGDRAAFAQDLKTRGLIGTQMANQAAGNIDPNFGSPVDVRASAAQLGRLDALTIRANAERNAVGYENEATLEKFKAENAETEGWMKAGASILGGVTSVSDKWLSFKRAGVFG